MDRSVSYYNASSASEAYNLAKEQITPDYVAKFNIPCDINYTPGSRIEATGKGFTLTINFTESAAEVDLELSFMYKPFKNKVLEKIESKLKKTV